MSRELFTFDGSQMIPSGEKPYRSRCGASVMRCYGQSGDCSQPSPPRPLVLIHAPQASQLPFQLHTLSRPVRVRGRGAAERSPLLRRNRRPSLSAHRPGVLLRIGRVIQISAHHESQNPLADGEPPRVLLARLGAKAITQAQPLGDPLLDEPAHDHGRDTVRTGRG